MMANCHFLAFDKSSCLLVKEGNTVLLMRARAL